MQPPDGFRHAYSITVRFADMDAMQHVNNAMYLSYLEQARLVYYDAVLGAAGVRRRDPGTIVARVCIDYKLSLVMNDEAVVWTRITRLGNKSITLAQHIYRRGDAALSAVAEVTTVVFDYDAEQSTPIPDEWRRLFVAYEPTLKG